MSAKHWKLVISPLSVGALGKPAREVIVSSDNWLSALRLARKTLGEEGGVPPGASVVMSSSGEVTILDSAQRLRYVLARSEEPSARPTPAPRAAPAPLPERPSLPHPSQPTAPPVTRPRAVTVAYSAEDAAAARSQLGSAVTQAAVPPVASPSARPSPLPPRVVRPESPFAPDTPAAPAGGFAPARPSQRPLAPAPVEAGAPVEPAVPAFPAATAGGPTQRPATPAYRSEESGELPEVADAVPLTQPRGAGDHAGRSALAPAPAAARAELAPAPGPSANPAPQPPRPGLRKPTMAYSPEESASLRAQMPPVQTEPRNSALLRAEDLPSVQSMLVTLGYRDEEQGPSSQLTYRERSYYWPPPVIRSEVERALYGELGSMRRNLEGRPRGQYVNLAVFDHAFRERPERPPVATLQWKDWRGEPVLSWAGEPQASGWTAAPAEHAVRSSFTPQRDSGSPPRDSATSSGGLPPAASPAATPARPGGPPSSTRQATPVPWIDPMAPIGVAHVPPPPPAATSAPAARAPALAPSAAAPRSALLTPDPTRQASRDSTGDQDKRLAIAFEATQDLYFLATPADGLDFAVKLLQELVPSEAISSCIYDINTDEFRFVAVVGVGAAERRAAAVRSSAGLFAAAVRSGRDDLVIPDVTSEPRYEPDCDGRTGLDARNMLFLPLHKADQLFGMLQLINRTGPRGFTESDVAVASYVANQVTEFLRSKRGLGRQ